MSARDKLPVQDNGVLRFLTAGSVDDGKSTLIGRLLYDTKAVLSDQLAAVARTSAKRGTDLDLSLLTDGLTAEREQGITIDIAYRYFATACRKFIIADAPGHEQYTRNMVTAASTAQLAVLLVDARHGIVTQTRRHATLAHLLGIRHLVVAVNKMDLVGFREEDYARIVADFREFARRTGIDEAGVRYVPMSALGGDMVVERGGRLPWYSGPTLLAILETTPIGLASTRAGFRLPVQYVSRPNGEGRRGYLGRVEAGSIGVGDRVTALPSGRTTTIAEIRTYDGPRDRARLHDAVTVALADEIDVSRGDMIVAAAAAPDPARRIDATLCWLGERPLDLRRTYILRHTTREVRARVEGLDHLWNVSTQSREPAPEALAMNDIGQATIALAQPIVADRYDDSPATGSFILIDEATNGTVAAGMIR
ncbi:MAG TPA: GTP-binding protein [Casimicrobiaceae bacterium]|nr:GTP-binding protein [Casimicrobiaceae bacterium]